MGSTNVTASAGVLLQAIYGARVPADTGAALRMLEASPYAPADPAKAAALRELVVAAAGQGLDGMRAAAARLTAHAQPGTTTHKPLGGVVTLQLEELAARRAGRPAVVISAARAAELFVEIAAAPDIPHDFLDDGCHYRAHAVAKRLEEAGVAAEKVFLVPTKGDLRIDAPKAALGFTIAMFHVAACVSVRTPEGRIERRVIDPSLCDGPVPVETWAATMGAVGGAPCEIIYLPRFALMLQERDDPPSAWRQADLQEAWSWNDDYLEVQKGMRESGFYEELRTLAKMGGEPD